MDSSLIQALFDWIRTHETWAGLAVLAISMSESLAVVGLIVPGVLMMFAIGALISTGVLDWWATLGWAVAGAIIGDGVSFWLGHHYREKICCIWPFRRFPALIVRGKEFFGRHGGKSVLFGRFVGPVRPIIPVVAGVMGMRVIHFYAINVLSAVLWAPAYLLPGIVFGASLNLATEVASRLAALLLGGLLIGWLVLWLTHRASGYLLPRADAILTRLMNWGRTHPRFGDLVQSVIDPQKPEARGLAVLGLILILAGWMLLIPVQRMDVMALRTTTDTAVFNLLQNIRTPWADQLLVLINALGAPSVLLALGVAVGLWLAFLRRWLALGHWLAAYAFGTVLTFAASRDLIEAWPREAEGGLLLSSWPHTQLTLAPAVYGFLAVLVTQGLRGPRRWPVYGVAGLLILALMVAQFYLGALRLSVGMISVGLALVWVIILGVAYRRHITTAPSAVRLGLLCLTTLLAATAWYDSQFEDRDLARYAVTRITRPIASDTWWQRDWQTLPAFRLDLHGAAAQPLTVQWAGPLRELRERLAQAGWKPPLPARGANLLQWLRPTPPLMELPVLPQVHDGQHESLLLVQPTGDVNRGLVLRLWRSSWVLAQSGTPIWVGYVAYLRPLHPLPLFTAPVTAKDFDGPRQMLAAELAGLDGRVATRPRSAVAADHVGGWDGGVLLLRPRGYRQ